MHSDSLIHIVLFIDPSHDGGVVAVNIVVTGGAGAIGRHLVKQLLHEGHQVVVIDNLFRSISSFDIPELVGAYCVWADIREYECIAQYFRGAEVVYHLAAHSNVRGAEQDPDYCESTNMLGTENVANACLQYGVRHLIFTSSREVYGDAQCLPVPESHALRPVNVYGKSKLWGEQLLAEYAHRGLDVSIVRLSNVVCPVDEGRVLSIWQEKALLRQNLILFGGEQRIDFVAETTVVRALRALLDVGPLCGPVNVGGGGSRSLKEVAQAVCDWYGIELDLQPAKSFEVAQYEADITRLREWLGVCPEEDGDPLNIIFPPN